MKKKRFDGKIYSKVLRNAMFERGKTVRKLAKEIKMSPTTLHRVMLGKTPDMETFLSIENWLAHP